MWRGVQVSASGRQEALVLLLLTPASRQVRAQWEAGSVNRGFAVSQGLYQPAGGFLGRRCSALFSGWPQKVAGDESQL